jgi:archaellum biogenesis ATPase FlaH
MGNATNGGVNGGAAERAVEDSLHAIRVLFEPGDVIEIRALNVGRTSDRAGVTYSGYFTFENEKAIGDAIRRLDGRAEGVYVVLNRFNPSLLARANNRLQVRPRNTTSDLDIIQRRWLYIDVDAKRPAGISATDAEHEAALQRTVRIRQFLRSRAWPEPVSADSANGGHLLYLLPPLDLVRAGELVKACLKTLAARFSDATVTVDQSTVTAARICKLYGTLACKGDATPDRPHRRARLLDEPERIEAVLIEALESLANEAETAVPSAAERVGRVSLRTQFNIEDWLASSGLELIKGPEPYEGGRRWILRTCPFNTEHQKPVIIEFPSGALCYTCLHNSCAQNDWKALRRRVDPGYHETNSAFPSPAKVSADTTPLITNLSQIPSVWSLEANLEWCVENMIAKGSVTLISAESGTGKTWLAYYIAGSVAHGSPILGRRVKQEKVLYLDGENPLYVVKQRLLDLGIAATPDLTIWGGWNISPPPGPLSAVVREFAREHKGLVIYDSLIEFHPGSEQSSTETRAFMRQFRALANLGATVIVLHNAGKAETAKLYRGSSDIKAAVDTAYLLRSDDDEPEKLGKLYMNCFKGRLMPGQNFGLQFCPEQGFVQCETFVPTNTVEEIISDILGNHPRSNQSQIVKMARAQGCSRRQAEESLKNGPWDRASGPKNSTLYSLSPAELG